MHNLKSEFFFVRNKKIGKRCLIEFNSYENFYSKQGRRNDIWNLDFLPFKHFLAQITFCQLHHLNP